MEHTGTIILHNHSAQALWDHELIGQLSDGMWENTRPHDHWQFWRGLQSTVQYGIARVVPKQPFYGRFPKTNYNFARLWGKDVGLGHRMVNLGRMGHATYISQYEMTYDLARASKYMPAGGWEEFMLHKDDAVARYVVGPLRSKVTDELACAYYNCRYTDKDMKLDVNRIKEAMQTVYEQD